MKKRISLLLIVLLCVFNIALASPPTSPTQVKFVSDIIRLIQFLTGTLTLLIPTSTGVYFMWMNYKKSHESDLAKVKEYEDKVKNIVQSAVIATGGAGIITAVLSFFR